MGQTEIAQSAPCSGDDHRGAEAPPTPPPAPLDSKPREMRRRTPRRARHRCHRHERHGRDHLRAPLSGLSTRSSAARRPLPEIQSTTTHMPNASPRALHHHDRRMIHLGGPATPRPVVPWPHVTAAPHQSRGCLAVLRSPVQRLEELEDSASLPGEERSR
jgi:hypothetical protein